MKKCLLISRFGAKNIGDLVISNELYKIVSSYFSVDRYDYFTDSLNIRDINNILDKKEKKNYLAKLEIATFLSSIGFRKVYGKFQKYKKKFEIKEDNFSEIIARYDVVIIGGGNMLMSLNSVNTSVIKFDKFVTQAKVQNKPIFIMGIGMGPFKIKSHAIESVSILNKCDFITFRDKDSYNIYMDNGGIKEKASISIDSAFYIEKESRETENINHNCIAINIIDSKLFGYDYKEYQKSINNYVELINRVINELNLNIVLFGTTIDDQKAINDVYKLIKDKEKVKKVDINGLKDLINIYNKVDLLIGTRMHSMIIAYTQELPLIGLSWQKKVDSLFEIIDESDSLYEFENMAIEADNIINSCRIKLDNLEGQKELINQKLLLIRNRASYDKEILELLD